MTIEVLDGFEGLRSLETIAAVIARSQIVVVKPLKLKQLPNGFEKIDIAILDWIAADARQRGHRFVWM